MMPLLGRGISMFTVTNLNTVTTFVATVISNTKDLAAPSGLLCVPSGYVVCAVANSTTSATATATPAAVK